MENKYRNMMDEVRAPEGLRQEVMNISGQERTKKTRPIPVRVLMVATCVCALLVTVAVAAEIAGFDFVRIFRGTEEVREHYEVAPGSIAAIPLEEFSPEVQALAAPYQDTDYHNEYLGFDTWEEAEEFLGREIARNPILAQAEYLPNGYSSEGNHVDGNCMVWAVIKYGVLEQFFVSANYDLHSEEWGALRVNVTAQVVVGGNPESAYMGFYFNDLLTIEDQEDYLTANGLETVILNMSRVPAEGNAFSGGEYHAHFFLRGIRFWVMANYGPEDQETVLAGLKEVLDNFK